MHAPKDSFIHSYWNGKLPFVYILIQFGRIAVVTAKIYNDAVDGVNVHNVYFVQIYECDLQFIRPLK